MAKTPTLYNGDGDDTETELPFKWEICGACSGHGKSSAYLGAYTEDDMAEAGPDFHDEYMRGGYDRTCDACDGEGKVKIADVSRMSKEHRAEWEVQCEVDSELYAIERSERLFGC